MPFWQLLPNLIRMAINTARSTTPLSEGPSPVQRYLGLVARHPFLTLACIVLPMLAAFALASRQPEKFSASAQVQVARQNLAFALTGTPDPTASTSDFTAVLQTEAALAQSSEIERTLPDGPSDNIEANGTVKPSTVSDVLNFSVTAKDAGSAIRQTNQYANAYVRLRRLIDENALTAAVTTAQRKLRAERERDPGSALSAELERKVQQLQTLQALQSPRVTFIGPATDATKIAPRPTRAAILGLIIGLAIAGILLTLLDVLNTRVRSATDVEDRTGLPVLAHVRKARGKSRADASRRASMDLLRARLERLGLGTSSRSIVLSRVGASDVGAWAPAGLGAAFARIGKQAAVLRFMSDDPRASEIRAPADQLLVGTPRAMSSDLGTLPTLQRVTDADGVLMAYSPQTISGSMGPEHLRGLVETLLESVDVVIVDAPAPWSSLGIATLSSEPDIGLFVIGVDDTTRQDLATLNDALPSFNAKTLGTLVVERQPRRRRAKPS